VFDCIKRNDFKFKYTLSHVSRIFVTVSVITALAFLCLLDGQVIGCKYSTFCSCAHCANFCIVLISAILTGVETLLFMCWLLAMVNNLCYFDIFCMYVIPWGITGSSGFLVIFGVFCMLP
jgi:hypothetical protein